MEGMRDLLRGTLGRSLRAAREDDRLAAAWTVACGRAMAERGSVVAYDAGVVRVEVQDPVWLGQMNALRGALAHDMEKIAGVRVTAVEFKLKRTPQAGGRRPGGR